MVQYRIPASPTYNFLTIDRFGGLNESAKIADNESPDCLNVMINENDQLTKRWGYKALLGTPLGVGKINGLFYFSEKLIIAHSTKLYSMDLDGTPTELYSPVTDTKMRSFVMKDKLYLINGHEFLMYDGVTVEPVENNAYVPTLTMGRGHEGGGTAYEQWNLLGKKFRDSFSPDGTKNTFQLSLKELDADTVTASIDGGVTFDQVEGTDFTVDRQTGIVTFTAIPPQGTDTVVIEATKTKTGFPEKIKGCTHAVLFGGANDTRVLLTGNSSYKNTIYRSGLFDPTYWPENDYSREGVEGFNSFAIQYDTNVLFREKSIWNMQFALENGQPTYTMKPINNQIGCLAPDSVQLIENSPFFLTKQGVYQLTGGTVRDERNVQYVSDGIFSLMNESNLEDAFAIDFDQKYLLAVNGKVYVADYRRKKVNSQGITQPVWFKWDNIPASCFIEIGGYLYFGGTDGQIYKFLKKGETGYADDNGQAMNVYWYSKDFPFNAEHLYKYVRTVNIVLLPATHASAELYYSTDQQSYQDSINISMGVFDFSDMDFSNFSFETSFKPQSVTEDIDEDDIVFIQLKIQNQNINEDMTVSSITMKYRYRSEVI